MTRSVVYSPRAQQQLTDLYLWIVIAFAVHEETVEVHGVYYGGQDYERS